MSVSVKGVTRWAMVGMLLVQVGCTDKLRKEGFDRISVGVATRQARAEYWGMKAKMVLPVAEIRGKKKLTENLDLSLRGQFSAGKIKFMDELHGEASWNFESLGLSLDYFPLKTRLLGGEIGMEVYRAEYDISGRLGSVRHQVSGQLWGGGVNLGLVGEIPLDQNDRWRFVWNAGYNLTTTHAEHISADLDGWYAGASLQFRF